VHKCIVFSIPITLVGLAAYFYITVVFTPLSDMDMKESNLATLKNFKSKF